MSLFWIFFYLYIFFNFSFSKLFLKNLCSDFLNTNQNISGSPLRQQFQLLNDLENQCLATLNYVAPFCFILFCHLDEEVVLLRLNSFNKNPIEYFAK